MISSNAAKMKFTGLPTCAGIPMRDLLAGCMAGLIEDTPLLDLNMMEEGSARTPQVIVALHCSLDKVCIPSWIA